LHPYFLGFEISGIMLEVIRATTAATIPISKRVYGKGIELTTNVANNFTKNKCPKNNYDLFHFVWPLSEQQ
jgi:hypothetical protein